MTTFRLVAAYKTLQSADIYTRIKCAEVALLLVNVSQVESAYSFFFIVYFSWLNLNFVSYNLPISTILVPKCLIINNFWFLNSFTQF